MAIPILGTYTCYYASRRLVSIVVGFTHCSIPMWYTIIQRNILLSSMRWLIAGIMSLTFSSTELHEEAMAR